MSLTMRDYKIFILILLKIFIINVCAMGQIDPIIAALDNPDVSIRHSALIKIQDEVLEQYASALEERIFSQEEPFIIMEYLRALDIIKADNIEDIAFEFIDFADNFSTMEPTRDPLEAKVFATEVLFNVNNYSTVVYVFEILERDWPLINITAFNLLDDIVENVPQYEADAKSMLLNIVDNSDNNDYRSYAIQHLEENYGIDLLNNYVNLFQHDSYWIVRFHCLEYLCKYNYSGLNPLLKIRLVNDAYWVLRKSIADSLLNSFGEPSDLKAVIDYQPNEPNETARSLMAYSIDDFIPPRPTVPTSEMITNLIGYTDELYQYGWITEVNVYNQYLAYLKDIEKAYSNKEKELLCEKLNEYSDYTEGLHQSLLTEEGYKFMHYHGTYIKENVEDEFGKCE